MTRAYFPVCAGGAECRLRLTLRGQRALTEEFGGEAMEVLLDAATQPEKLTFLLTQALNWPGNENPIRDGEALYDLLVDDGWQGTERFARLVFSVGAASGLLTGEQAQLLGDRVKESLKTVFDPGKEK